MLLDLINNAVQKYFDSDVEIAKQLSSLEGKSLLIKLTDVKRDFIVTAKQSTLVVNAYKMANDENDSGDQEAITTRIETNVISLLRLGMGADYKDLLSNGALKLQGDVELANHLRSIFSQVDIDWEEIASKYMGDSVAHQLGNFARRFRSYKKRSVDNFRLDVSEFIQEESRLAPTKTELDHFLNDVDSLNADVERLEARMQRLDEAIAIQDDDELLTGATR